MVADAGYDFLPSLYFDAFEPLDDEWHVIDQNKQWVLWQSVYNGEIYQWITPVGHPKPSGPYRPKPLAYLPAWRAVIGKIGYQSTTLGATADYIPRRPVAPAAPAVTPPAQRWPSREARVAALRVELAMLPADRLKKGLA